MNDETRFNGLMQQLKTMRECGLQDSPSYERLTHLALQNAPDDLLSAIMDRAVKCGMVPPAAGVDADGQKVWKMEVVAKWLGVPDQEIEQTIEDFEDEVGTFQRIDPATIQRVH